MEIIEMLNQGSGALAFVGGVGLTFWRMDKRVSRIEWKVFGMNEGEK